MEEGTAFKNLNTSDSKKSSRIIWIVFILAGLSGIGWWFVIASKKDQQLEIQKPIPQKIEGEFFLLEKLQAGQFADGYAEGEKLIVQHPDSEFILKMTALLYFGEGLQRHDRVVLERAEDLFTHLYTKNPNDFAIILSIAQTKGLLARPEEGILLLEQTLQNFPEQETAIFFELGKLHDQAGNRERAYTYLQKASKQISPLDTRVSGAYFLLGRLELQEDMHPNQKNMREMQKYISKLIDPRRTNAERAMGYALLSELEHTKNNQSQAIDAAKKAIALEPNSAAWQHALGEVLLEGHANEKDIFYTNRLDEAITTLEKSLQSQNGKMLSHSYYLLGVAYQLNEENDKAQKMWREGLRIVPIDPFFPQWFKKTVKKNLESALERPEQFLVK